MVCANFIVALLAANSNIMLAVFYGCCTCCFIGRVLGRFYKNPIMLGYSLTLVELQEYLQPGHGAAVPLGGHVVLSLTCA